MRGVKSLLVLTLLLAGLGAYIYFVESKKPQEAATVAGPKVFAVRADAIDEITVKSAGGDTTTLKKTNGSWQITNPIDAPADEAEVSGLLTGLATVDSVRTIDENPGDLTQFGLANPRVEITFKAAGGAPARRLLLGDKTATSGDLYVKLPNEKKVFLIAGSYDASFDRSTFDLRQKSLLTFDRDKVDWLTVESPGKAVVLTRANGEWTIEKPYQAPADYGTVEGLIGRVQTAQMKAITAPDAVDLKPYGLDKPDVSITFGLGTSQATLMLGKKADTSTRVREGRVAADGLHCRFGPGRGREQDRRPVAAQGRVRVPRLRRHGHPGHPRRRNARLREDDGPGQECGREVA